MGGKLYFLFLATLMTVAVSGAPTNKKMCYNLACADYAAICYYSAQTSDKADAIMETTMCLDSAENVLQRETKKRENILGSEFSTEHILPFKNKNWIGSGDVPETAAEVFLRVDNNADNDNPELPL